MTRITILISFLALLTLNINAQTDSIVATTKVLGGYKFEHNDKVVNQKAMLIIMSEHQEAMSYMSRAKTYYDLSIVLGCSVGVLIGWPIGTAICGGDPNWVLAGIGASLSVLLIPLAIAGNTNALNAIAIYNSSLNSTSFQNEIKLDLGLTSHGIGLKLTF